MNNEYCIFILSHQRANNVKTYKSLRECGYTGQIVIVIDNEDDQADVYLKNFEHVEVFDKQATAMTFDIGDNFKHRGSVVYARNACFDIAEKLNYKYFIEMDDDYSTFLFRLYSQENQIPKVIRNLDEVIKSWLTFYKSTNAHTIAMAQGGDFIGGKHNKVYAKNPTLTRKCMNSFLCSTDRRFTFVSRLNDDVTTYVSGSTKGLLTFTIPFCSIEQVQTQKSTGGLTELYLKYGTYVKSFYSVMFQPSSVTVGWLQSSHKRIHHKVDSDKTYPKIIRESNKKTA